MKSKTARFILALIALHLLGGTPARAADATPTAATPETARTETSSSLPPLSTADTHPYSQMFTLEAGPFRPASLSVSNSNARYDYTGASLNSYLAEPGWSIKLFSLLGAVSLEESFGVSMFKASLPGKGASISLITLGIDTRLKHSWEWFPVRSIVPFIEGGYQYTFYTQSGPSDFESAQGSVGNLVAGAGLDLWVNALFGGTIDAVNKYNAIPVFLTAKINYIAPGANGVNLGSTSFLAGLSIGI